MMLKVEGEKVLSNTYRIKEGEESRRRHFYRPQHRPRWSIGTIDTETRAKFSSCPDAAKKLLRKEFVIHLKSDIFRLDIVAASSNEIEFKVN